MKIYQDKIDDEHLDSFWYDGTIATKGKYTLEATGEVKINQFGNGEYIGMFDGQVRDNFVMPKNDKELSEIFNGKEGYCVDMSNWFAIRSKDNYYTDEICDDYDDGILRLKEIK